MDAEQLGRALDAIATAHIPEGQNLWPEVARRVRQQEKDRRGSCIRFLLIRSISVSIIALLGVTVFVPSAQATARTIMNAGVRFIRGWTISTPTPAVGTTEEFQALPLLSLDDAKQRLPFAVPLPQWLPRPLDLKGAYVQGAWVHVVYRDRETLQGALGIEVRQAVSNDTHVFPEGAEQQVMVNGVAALYIHGSWDQQLRWHEETDLQAIVWHANGLTFFVQASELGLSRDDLIRIAESLR